MTLLETMVYYALLVIFVALWYAWLSDVTSSCERWWSSTQTHGSVCYAFQVLARDIQEGPSDANAWFVSAHECGWRTQADGMRIVYKDHVLWRYRKKPGNDEQRMVLVQAVDSCELSASGTVIICSLVCQGRRYCRALYRMSKVWPCSYLSSSSVLG